MAKTLFDVKYDINADANLCDGRVCVEQDGDGTTLTATDGDIVRLTLPFENIRELGVFPHIGCASLEATMRDGDRVYICRFTNSCVGMMSEFIRAANFYAETGKYSPMHDVNDVCPTCGTKFIPNTKICPKCASKTPIFKRAIEAGGNFAKFFIIGALLVLAANVIMLIVPYINRLLVDGYLYPASKGDVLPDEPIKAVLSLVAAMAGCQVLSQLLTLVSRRLINKGSSEFSHAMRTKLFTKIQKLSLSSASRHSAGDLIKRVTNDTAVVSDFLQEQLLWIIQVGVIFAGVTIYLFVTRPLMALFVFLPVPIVLFLMQKTRYFIHMKYYRQWVASTRCGAILHDILKGIRVVKTFGTEKQETDKYAETSVALAEASQKTEQAAALIFPPMSFLITIGEFFVLYFGANLILNGNMQLGELTQLATYTAYIYGPLRTIANLPSSIANASTSMAKLNEILDEDPEIDEDEEVLFPEIHGNITFENATFGYKSYEPVLKNINLDIRQGEMIGLVGHSGVGKSTLINLIMRLYDVNSGAVKIDGTDIRNISKEALCNSIGVVFQETFLFAGSVYDNIIYARPTATAEEVFAAAKIANAHEFIIKLPDAYNTLVGEHGYSLSGGERQRIAIARAVLRDPAILILDEATASLDVETESKIQDALEKLVKGRTTIAIAHRLSTLRHADRLVVLEKGKVEEVGTHDELLRNKGTYFNLVMAQRQTSKLADKGGVKATK